MSAVEGSRLPGPRVGAPDTAEHGATSLPILCPYLATMDGNWRSATAVRDHRCMAVSPPVPLAAEKQRRLCLVDRHVDCATYGVAVAGHASPRLSVPSRPVARMTPVILDHGRFDLRLPAFRADRPTGQAVLVAVLAVAFLAILLSRPSGAPGLAGSGASGAATPGGSGAPTEVAAASPTVTVSQAPPTEAPATEPPASSTPVASEAAPSPASSEPPTSGATYRVKSGDTLSAIAARFDTTTRVLIRLNGITDPSKLKIGQILKLP
jgi:hypothetical protein